jgi:Ser/Thr protein kinase RdoA (MazF antagonist)
MGKEAAAPDWAPLTDAEVEAVLGGPAEVLWRSPRPMSAAALVRASHGTVFVKRHHERVRSAGQLGDEHALAGYLRSAGLPVPAVLVLAAGGQGEFCYEVAETAAGIDVYRDAVSWSPYLSTGHAAAAGAALARLHLAAAGFRRPARPMAVLMNSCEIVCSSAPLIAIERLAGCWAGLAGYLARRRGDLIRWVLPLICRAGPALRALPSQWGHGDWHPSNLTWTSAGPDGQVAGILDLGLANRTSAVHDLAVALERSVVGWLDLAETGSAPVDLAAAGALLHGYQAVRPLSRTESAALPLVLPVVHVEYALSEIEYFADVVHSRPNAELACQYLIGHARWFTGPEGTALLRHVERAAARSSPHRVL